MKLYIQSKKKNNHLKVTYFGTRERTPHEFPHDCRAAWVVVCVRCVFLLSTNRYVFESKTGQYEKKMFSGDLL